MRRTGPAIISWPRGNDRSYDCSGSGKETFSQGSFWTGYGQQTFGWKMLDGGCKTVFGGKLAEGGADRVRNGATVRWVSVTTCVSTTGIQPAHT
jgi:hypothetical protein